MLDWGRWSRAEGSFNWGERDHFIGRLASHGIRSVPFVWGSPQLGGQRSASRSPRSTATPTSRRGGTSSRRRWRATDRAAATGPTTTTEQFPERAPPLPIQSWQIWNEPNLKKFFSPGQNVQQSAQKYATLLQISHDAIKSRDPQAQIVLAGMPAIGDSKAWDFLDNLYQVPGIKSDFDAAALHPYACDV